MLQEIIFNIDFFHEIDDDVFIKINLLEMLNRQIDEDLSLMEKYVQIDDIKSWRGQIHKLGGSCANLGAVKLASLCKVAEKIDEQNIKIQQKAICDSAIELKAYTVDLIANLKNTISE